MKIDPYFQRVLDVLIGSFGSVPAVQDWHNRGCPVVEDPLKVEAPSWPFWMGSRFMNLTGNINMDTYPELRRAIVEAEKREADLAAAKRDLRVRAETIEELQGRITKFVQDLAAANARIKGLEGVIAAQKDSFYGRVRIETAEHIRNAALEEAAKAVHEWDSAADITGGWWRTGIAE